MSATAAMSRERQNNESRQSDVRKRGNGDHKKDNHEERAGDSHSEEGAKEDAAAGIAITADDTVSAKYRDCTDLYALSDTLNCARQSLCVPCGYKIGTFDVSLDKEFTSLVPNERPENCPRFLSGDRSRKGGREGIMGFRRGMNVLTVGDGDLSFSLAISRAIMPKDGDPLRNGQLVSTSYESHDVLTRVYPNIGDTMRELKSLGANICCEVDATRLAETLSAKIARKTQKFHRIVWNFPCSAVPSGQDGQNDAMETNKHLIRAFMRSALQFLEDGGEIHMAHKTKPPFNQWKMEEVALEGLGLLNRRRMKFKGRVVLDRCCIPPYTPRKALDKKSFTCHDACFFVFGQEEAQEAQNQINFPLLIPSSSDCCDTEKGEGALVPVTTDMLKEIRKILMEYKKQSKHQSKKRQFGRLHSRNKQKRKY